MTSKIFDEAYRICFNQLVFISRCYRFICGKTEIKALLSQPLPPPSNQNVVMIEGYWLARGNMEPKMSEKVVHQSSA